MMTKTSKISPATTKSGSPCKRCVKSIEKNNARCWQHKTASASYGEKGEMKYNLMSPAKSKTEHKVEHSEDKFRFQNEDEVPRTKAGKPCKRCINAQKPCWQHAHASHAKAFEATLGSKVCSPCTPTHNTCRGTKKDGSQCTRKVKGLYCFQHKTQATNAPSGKDKVAKELKFNTVSKMTLPKEPKIKPGRKAPKESASKFEVGQRKVGLDKEMWEVRTVTRKAAPESTYKRWFRVVMSALASTPAASAQSQTGRYVLASREDDGDFLFAAKLALFMFLIFFVFPWIVCNLVYAINGSGRRTEYGYMGRHISRNGSYMRKHRARF